MGSKSRRIPTTWGSIAELVYGKALNTDYRSDEGDVRVFGTNGPIGWTDVPHCKSSGVVVGRKGAYRGVHFAQGPFAVIDTAYWLRPLETAPEFDMYWAYLALNLVDLNTLDSGSAIPSLSRDDFYAIEVEIPSLAEQRAIATVLWRINDRIEICRTQAATLESIAAAIFKSRFVDFDGVTEFEESEIGPIPRGWSIVATSDIAELVLGGTPSRSNPDFWDGGSIPWINSGQANRFRVTRPTTLITETALAKSAAKVMPVGTTVVAITGATLGKVSRLEISAAGNQSLVGIVSSSDYLRDFIYFRICADRGRLLAGATGAAQQHINKQDVARLQVVLPPDRELVGFAELVGPLMARIGNLCRSGDALQSLRDVLLPKLVSGELKIPDSLLEIYGGDPTLAGG
jgi:type I restriction enzyme S subunit